MIGVLMAMESEARGVVNRMSVDRTEKWGITEIRTGEFSGRRICTARSGVGKVMSAATATCLIERYRVGALIYLGIAGAIAPELEIGDIVIATECLQHDVDATMFHFKRGEMPYDGIHWLPADRGLLEAARGYVPETGKIVSGRIVTGDQFCNLERREHMPYLTEELDAVAIDMEGAAAALVAHVLEVPFLHVRIISDKADGTAKVDFQRFIPVAADRIADFLAYLVSGIEIG